MYDELPIPRDDAHLAEIVMGAADREIAADFEKQVGEKLEPSSYIERVLSFHGDNLEMVVTCYSQNTGYGGGGHYFTVYANAYGWGPDAPDRLQLKSIMMYVEGEPYSVNIADSDVAYDTSPRPEITPESRKV